MTGDAGEVGFAAVVALDDVEVGGIDGGVADADANVVGVKIREVVRGGADDFGRGAVFGDEEAEGRHGTERGMEPERALLGFLVGLAGEETAGDDGVDGVFVVGEGNERRGEAGRRDVGGDDALVEAARGVEAIGDAGVPIGFGSEEDDVLGFVEAAADAEDFDEGEGGSDGGEEAGEEFASGALDGADDVHDEGAVVGEAVVDELEEFFAGEVDGDGPDAVVGVAEDEVPALFGFVVEEEEAAGIAGVGVDVGVFVELEELAADIDDAGVDFGDVDVGVGEGAGEFVGHAEGAGAEKEGAIEGEVFVELGEAPVVLVGEDEVAGIRVHAAFLGAIEFEDAAFVGAGAVFGDADAVIEGFFLVDDIGRRDGAFAEGDGGGDEAGEEDGKLLAEGIFGQ